MTLRLNDIVVDCIIGDLPSERRVAQRLAVDVELALNDLAAETDSLSDTVDYSVLVGKVRSALKAAKCRMIERAAKVVATVCMAEPKVLSVRAAVRKSGSVAGLGSAEVIYEESR